MTYLVETCCFKDNIALLLQWLYSMYNRSSLQDKNTADFTLIPLYLADSALSHNPRRKSK